MCNIIEYNAGGRIIHIADIKKEYIDNIINAAGDCDYIDKVVLFGSCLEDRCKEDSDIDLAIFGNVSRGKCLTSNIYEEFLTRVFAYNNYCQAYDILYFKTGEKNNSSIIADINRGEILYETEHQVNHGAG